MVARNHAKPPISSHGLFPVIVAIWFAALFGLGSLVLPTILLEHITTGTGLAWLVPATAPPLGVTARIAISSSAAVAGALLGFVIARRVAEAQAYARPANVDRRLRFAQHDSGNRVRRPISASKELGTARVDAPAEARMFAPAAMPGRRRALAMTEEQGPSQYLQRAPLPGDARWADDHPLMPSAAAAAEKTMARHGYGTQQPAQAGPEPLELEAYAESVHEDYEGMAAFRNPSTEAFSASVPEAEAGAPAPFAHPAFDSPETSYAQIAAAPVAASPARQFSAPTQFAPPTQSVPQQFAPPVQAAPQGFAQPAFATAQGDVALPFARNSAPAQPIAQFAPAMPADAEDEPLTFVAPSQLKHASAPPDPTGSSVAEPLRALLVGDARPIDGASGPLEQLGMVELAERLGQSMLRRKRDEVAQPSVTAELAAAPRAEAPAVEFVPVNPVASKQSGGGRLPADQSRAFDQLPANLAPPPPVVPAALRPLTLELEEFGEDEEEDEFAASFSMPITGTPSAPDFSPFAASMDEDGEEESEDEADEEIATANYSSLLAMKNPFRGPAEFVRIELPEPEAGAIEPAVVFPGHSAPRANGGTAAAPLQFGAPPATLASAPQAPAPGLTESAPRRFDAPGEAAEQPARRKSQADPAETERALRSALATLQRMSGAA